MFFLLLKKNYSISILHGSESLPVVVYVISSETWTDVYFPKQLPNGQLDGIYEIMESSL